jgi:hypothetical protein
LARCAQPQKAAPPPARGGSAPGPASDPDDIEALHSALKALQIKLETRRAAVLEAAGMPSDTCRRSADPWSRRRAVVLEAAGMLDDDILGGDDDSWQVRDVLRQDEEARQLHDQTEQLRAKIQRVRFESANETGFADADGTKAVLGVTSGLKLPTKPCPLVSTRNKIATLIDSYHTRGVADRLIEQEVAKRRLPLLKAAGIEYSRWGPGLPREQEQALRSAVKKELELPRLGLVDAGGQSQHPDGQQMLSRGHRHGFIAAVTAAFADHYPLKLRPQHFWLLITQAVATHVDLNAEAVRESWVAHEGKQKLKVRCDEFTLGDGENDWASVVSGKPDCFATQIAANTVEGVAEARAPGFSGTAAAEDIAQKIVVMDICKNYFSYGMMTMCGFPQITLDGTVEDWLLLRESAERLLTRCEPEFAACWAKSLLPVLDKFSAARKGEEVDAMFWNSMCKLGGTHGSGATTWFNGWFNIFFPYINRRENEFCQPYSPDQRYVSTEDVGNDANKHTGERARGPDCETFGSGMSQAPVEWEYYGEKIPLEFNAGFIGAAQDVETLEITPNVGWYITYKLPEGAERSADDY